jgi:hypothetical protein
MMPPSPTSTRRAASRRQRDRDARSAPARSNAATVGSTAWSASSCNFAAGTTRGEQLAAAISRADQAEADRGAAGGIEG